jgi:hypothetical protein
MFMKGNKGGVTIAKMLPPGLEGNEIDDSNMLDDAMKSSAYLFGLNAVADYHITELRMWCCEREEDDIKMMMYEYLRAAEMKKFKEKIRNKLGEDTADTEKPAGGLLSPPPGGFLSPPRDSSGTKTSRPPRTRSEVGTTSTARLEEKNFAFDASKRTSLKRKSNSKQEIRSHPNKRLLQKWQCPRLHQRVHRRPRAPVSVDHVLPRTLGAKCRTKML